MCDSSPMLRLLTRVAVGLAICAGLLTSEAVAATFTVEPTQIVLSGRKSSVLLTLKNDSAEPLRFELSVFSWSQSPSGEMSLEPTDDIVFFPALLTIAPGESRHVRVGSATSATRARRRIASSSKNSLPCSARRTAFAS